MASWIGPLAFAGTASVMAPRPLPGHRVLAATLVNAGSEPVYVQASRLELYDDEGQAIRATVAFDPEGGTAALVHPKRALLRPGQTVPVVVAWRRPDDRSEATRLEYPEGSLPLAPPASAGA